ncbi:hypothetical protein [Massilia aquatica]|uniref:Uncharacterized protein n=1 Tax=Massilia aquatica TaxID=2609000 RepID=A0ABX0MCN1_9BURK|nr:hypothetical protein [Massilia aquatica]NHZ42382.1 hypothetical protein [Massilia aquatica]
MAEDYFPPGEPLSSSMRASVRPLVLLLETVILILTTFEMFIMFSFMLTGKQHQQSSSFYMASSVFMLGVFGHLFLCAGFFRYLVYRRQWSGHLPNIARYALIIGILADLFIFYTLSTTGPGTVGLGVGGWLIVSVAFGGPIAVAGHVLHAMRTGKNRDLPLCKAGTNYKWPP